jgi:hypothetical protein
VNPIIGYRLTGVVLNVIILKQRDGGLMWKFQMSLIYQRKVLEKRGKITSRAPWYITSHTIMNSKGAESPSKRIASKQTNKQPKGVLQLLR